MQISWNGLGSFTIVAKPLQTDVTLVTNPFTHADVKFRGTAASIVVQSHEGKDTSNLSAVTAEHPEEGRKTFIIPHAGEFEVQGIFVTGVHAPKKDGTPHTIYRFDAEGMRLGYLGALDRPLKSSELEALGPIDILIVPAGGDDVFSATQAAEAVAQVEPRMVIASYIGAGKYGTADALKRELGCQSEDVSKLKISKSGLPDEDMKMILFI